MPLFFLLSVPLHAQINTALLGPTTETTKLIKNITDGELTDIKSPGVIVANIVQIVLSFLGLIAVIMIMYAGFLWLTAAGEEEKAEKGRTLLFQSLIGLVIILSAYMVTYFVLVQLTKAVSGI